MTKRKRNTEPQTFECEGEEFQFRPMGAITSVSEFGSLVADLGDGVIEQLLLPGSIQTFLSSLTDKSRSGAVEITLRSVTRFLGEHDLGDRVTHYLDLCDVEIRHDGKWLPLCGHMDDVEKTLDTTGTDGFVLLSAAWHVAKESFGPLFARLRSSAVALATKSQARSIESEATA